MTVSLERLHKEQLEIALEIKKICEKNKIKYSIIAGTLLGAVRHGGFIPWDDDLDIGMLRKDYNRFISIAIKELRKDYFLQTWETDPYFALPYAKVRKNKTKLVEKQSASVKAHQGIFVDVFPFDNVPEKTTAKTLHKWLSWILIHVIMAKQGYGIGESGLDLKKSLYKLTGILTNPIPINNLKNILMKQMTKYNMLDAQEIVCLGGSYGYSKETVKKKWFEKLKPLNFEGHEMLAFQEYKEYLSKLYGDYMTPPPINGRLDRHEIIEIDI